MPTARQRRRAGVRDPLYGPFETNRPVRNIPRLPNQIGRSQGIGYGYAGFQPEASPPPGQYDPNLDAQDRAAGRGLGDFQADTRKNQTRADDDYRIARGDPAAGEAGTGLEGQRARGLSDIMRNYMILGQRHEASMRSQGVDEGGTAAASAARRTENKGREDTRLNQGVDRSLGALALNYQRGTADRAEGLGRAERERNFFSQDIGAAKWYQAGQAGYEAPGPPAGQQVAANGQVYKKVSVPGIPGDTYALPDGTLLSAPPGTAASKKWIQHNGYWGTEGTQDIIDRLRGVR